MICYLETPLRQCSLMLDYEAHERETITSEPHQNGAAVSPTSKKKTKERKIIAFIDKRAEEQQEMWVVEIGERNAPMGIAWSQTSDCHNKDACLNLWVCCSPI